MINSVSASIKSNGAFCRIKIKVQSIGMQIKQTLNNPNEVVFTAKNLDQENELVIVKIAISIPNKQISTENQTFKKRVDAIKVYLFFKKIPVKIIITLPIDSIKRKKSKFNLISSNITFPNQTTLPTSNKFIANRNNGAIKK